MKSTAILSLSLYLSLSVCVFVSLSVPDILMERERERGREPCSPGLNREEGACCGALLTGACEAATDPGGGSASLLGKQAPRVCFRVISSCTRFVAQRQPLCASLLLRHC